MTAVVCVVRQSQGSDDDIGIELQRERVAERAAALGDDDPDWIDLGVHTGFSVFMHGERDDRLDTNDQIQQLLSNLENGEYTHLVAWDDSRVARDQFYWVIKYNAVLGDVAFEFIQEPPEDELTFRVNRAVESEVKMREIEKTQDVVQKRADDGFDHGRPPFGFKFDDAGEYWVPGEDFDTAMEVLDLRDRDFSYAAIKDRTGVSRSTAYRIVEKREFYEEQAMLKSSGPGDQSVTQQGEQT